MKNIPLLLVALLSFTGSFAQEGSWKISFNKKVILAGTADQPLEGRALSAASIMKGKGNFTITYNMENADNSWNRTFYFNTANDKVIKQYVMKSQAGTISIPISVLQQFAKKKQALHIYTMSIPKDPNLAAVVRVRRVLLSKIEWL